MAALEYEIRKWRKTGNRPNDISARIDRKYAMLRASYGINFDPIAMLLKNSPNIYDQIDGLPNLELFFRRPIEIVLSLAERSDKLWCRYNNCWLTVFRFPGRFLVDNLVSEKKESWSQFSSESENDHLVHHKIARGRPDKSKFDGNYKYIKPIELAVFDHGIGQLISKDTIRLYGEFEAPIGKSPIGDDISFACVEITRRMWPPTKRKTGEIRKRGYLTRGHGYPVGLKDLERDLSESEVRIDQIPMIDNVCLDTYRD